jgi:hypothetical protein
MIARIMIDDGGEKSIANVSSSLGTARCQAGPQKILGQTFTHTCDICRRRVSLWEQTYMPRTKAGSRMWIEGPAPPGQYFSLPLALLIF